MQFFDLGMLCFLKKFYICQIFSKTKPPQVILISHFKITEEKTKFLLSYDFVVELNSTLFFKEEVNLTPVNTEATSSTALADNKVGNALWTNSGFRVFIKSTACRSNAISCSCFPEKKTF